MLVKKEIWSRAKSATLIKGEKGYIASLYACVFHEVIIGVYK